MTHPQQPAAPDEREAFEAWMRYEFYGDLASPAETWNEERGIYNVLEHHTAWKAWQARADAHTSNTCLPTYSELVGALREIEALDASVVGLDRIEYARGISRALLARIPT